MATIAEEFHHVLDNKWRCGILGSQDIDRMVAELERLRAEQDQPRLGCATTLELLTEVEARFSQNHRVGQMMLEARELCTQEELAYRTVDS